jgi:DNA gyrase/topoisomerase IV subunit A
MKAISLKANDKVVSAEVGSAANIIVTTTQGMVSIFASHEVPQSGITASGVTAIKSKVKQDSVIGGHWVYPDSDIYGLTTRGHIIRTDTASFEVKARLRVPVQWTTPIKSNPHELINTVIIRKHAYLNHDKISIEADVPLVLDLFDIKYPQSDNGKKFTTNEQTKLTKLWAIDRQTSVIPVDITAPEEPHKPEKSEEQDIQIALNFDETEA